MSWSRYEGKAPAEITLTGAARDAELEDFIRLQNPHLTDVRLEQATATGLTTNDSQIVSGTASPTWRMMAKAIAPTSDGGRSDPRFVISASPTSGKL